MININSKLDMIIKYRDKLVLEKKLPEPAIGYINSMLEAVLIFREKRKDKSDYILTCLDSLMRYFNNPDIKAWDTNTRLKEYMENKK